MTNFNSTFEHKLIYVFRINDELHNGLLKIGDATVHTNLPVESLVPNCRELNRAAKARIDSYTAISGLAYELLHTELAICTKVKDGIPHLVAFRDNAVHSVLIRSGIERHMFETESKGREWFKTDLQTVKNAIAAVKAGRVSLSGNEISDDHSPVIFRPEQSAAITQTLKTFKTGNRMLWNAKMRFGKTLSALEVAKRSNFQKTLIFTHRPVVSDGWFEDFQKIFYGTNYKFGSKTKGESIENLVDTDIPFVYFASIQDLRGSEAVGGKFDKNDYIFLIEWDFIIVDEAHEGTQTTLGQRVLETVLSNSPTKKPKLLELSGTPFNLLENFKQGEIYTWDYIMEQRAKRDWPLYHFGDSNPYEELPRLEIFTYDLDKLIPGYCDIQDNSFKFSEFFRTWTGDLSKDFKPIPQGAEQGDFVHKNDVLAFLNLLSQSNAENNFPFATEEYRNYYRHTLWMLPGVKEARALSKMLHNHPVFGCGQFEIVNVAGEGDEEENSKDALKSVREAIGSNPDETHTITLSCGRLTTGVTVPEWTAVLMLYGSFNTAASSYLQTIFRVQTPANINGKIKERCSVFDFAPDRTLKMVAEAGHLSSSVGKTNTDRVIMGELLNFCPVIAVEGSQMSTFDVDTLMQQLKKAYTDKVVKSGFDAKYLYNDNLLKLNEHDLAAFEELKKIVGASKQTKKVEMVDVNNQGFTDEEYNQVEQAQSKPKNQRTAEEEALLVERRKNQQNAQKARSILRGISIRIPLLVYGADVPWEQEITSDNITDLVDDASWEEFMPKGVTKEKFREFSKYYEQDVFVASGRTFRKMALSADDLAPTERVKKIAEIFAYFKNPDKETVLTPWRVVNMHMSDCLGGYNFFDKKFEYALDEPVFVDRGKVTHDVFCNPDAKVLEINSKTGLYPLYVAYSIFRNKLAVVPRERLTSETVWDIWRQTVENNIFVICKTKMARAITKRTLLGYKEGKLNAHAFDDLINQLKNKPEQFKEKVLRGSTWNRSEQTMKFDAIVGNPPYQIMDGGAQASATPIYNKFVEVAKSVQPVYISMIMPSRWMTGGKGLDSFRENMIHDKSMARLFDHADARDCFEQVEIKGGICYFLWDKTYSGKCEVAFYAEDKISMSTRYLVEEGDTIYVRNNQLLSIKGKCCGYEIPSFDTIVSSMKPYGLRGDFFKSPQKYGLPPISTENFEDSLTIIGLDDKMRRAYRYIPHNYPLPKRDMLNDFKIFVTRNYGVGAVGELPSNPLIAKPGTLCTETFVQIGPFADSQSAENCLKYMKTKFFRALVSIRKQDQGAGRDVYHYVPLQDFSCSSDIDWSKSINETNDMILQRYGLPINEIDIQLYQKYDLNIDEIRFVEDMIKSME